MTTVWLMVLCVTIVALAYIFYNYARIKKMDEGTDEMIQMSAIIRSGSETFLKTEFRSIWIVMILVALIFSLFIEKTSGLSFILGGAMSSIVCVLGMKSATYANVRTANKARETMSIGETVKVALCGGSISGLAVQCFGLMGFVLIMLITGGVSHDAVGTGLLLDLECNPTIMRMTTYSLGCSLVAMFNRVAGGNYTKAADISSDILGKIRHDLPEDDSRVPNVIADFIGDNVNDIAGNCSDLLESFVATMAASIMIGVTLYKTALNAGESFITDATFNATSIFPVVMAGVGLIGCLIGLGMAAFKKMGSNPAHELDLATWVSAGITVVLSGIAAYVIFSRVPLYTEFVLGWASPWVSAILGIISGIAIGSITEYYTSTEYKPTQKLAEMCPEGSAFVITKGDAIGSRSCLLPILVIGVALLVSGHLSGIYGIAISALGMLAFVGATVSIDAFGPIADNAGGLAESCHLPADVRVITDKLDAVGNTTAAIGKGFAIGSAAFATVSLIVAYVGNYTAVGAELTLNFASFVVVAGGIIGGALVEYFSAVLTDNTIESAKVMADEGDRMMSEPGVLEGTVTPDYNKMVAMAARLAIKKMVVPSVLALFIPIIGGFLFGVQFVGGILIGATVVAIPRAIFMGNSGGAFDNAKKYIESGSLKGYPKGSDAHKAAVVGDTVGDTRKDVVGVALDIFIKLMSTVANTLATLFTHLSLFG
ncbi:MAG: sodium-translocating pyrophosphatase [Lachnospiraceae bacterium]|nr:sodium-translocating pyrophosphatase [Lachnospiraceae bacterium]